MARHVVLAFFATTASALPSGPIGAPCFANESAIDLFTSVDMSGKVAVVTGSDRGIGLETARALAARHAKVILVGRNISKMKAAEDDIKRTLPGADLFVSQYTLDLSSFESVKIAAEGLQQFSAIHILVNNAGVDSTSRPTSTKDGFELVFEVDYQAQWLLTHLLLPQIRAGKGRIVNVASKAAAFACEMSERLNCMSLDRLPPPPTSGRVPVISLPRSNYGIAKLLMIRWTEDLARREAALGTGVTAFSLHPGYVNTSMGSSASSHFSKFACSVDGRQGAPCPTTPAEGALTPTFLALAPGIEKNSGSYYEWCSQTDFSTISTAGASQDYKNRLWSLTEKWLANFTQPIRQDEQEARRNGRPAIFYM